MERLLGGDFIHWDNIVDDILQQGQLLVEQALNPDSRKFVRVLLTGSPGSGKSCLAAKIAKNSDFPFIKVVTPEDMVSFNSKNKILRLGRLFRIGKVLSDQEDF